MEALLNELNNEISFSDGKPLGELVGPDRKATQIVSQKILQENEEQVDEIKDDYEEFVISKARELTELVLKNCAEDREEASSAIIRIKELIESQDKVIHGGSLQRLLQAIETRANITSTVVKAMEASAKILSSRKGPAKTVNNNTSNTAIGNDLISILEKGMQQR